MTPERISELGRVPFMRGVKPLRRPRRCVATVYGLDTEYTRNGELVCWTVSGPGGEELYSTRLDVAALERHVALTDPQATAAVFVSYFSLAELQFFDVAAEARELALFGRGSTDVRFHGRVVDVSIVDVARFFDGQSLAKAAASFGLQKGEYDVRDVTREHLRDPRFRDYALRDARLARIIFECLRAEYLELGVDLLANRTAASAAAATWRLNHLRAELPPPVRAVRRLGLRCAWGGRAEAFRRGAWSRARELDLKSAYPSAVLSFGGFPRPEDWRAERRVARLETAPFTLAVVDFKFPRGTRFPCLPVMHDGRMMFPLRGRSACTGDELRLALELGASIWPIEGAVADVGSDASAQSFMAWAMETRARVKGTARAYVAKLAANALTGKWIQNRDAVDYRRVLELAAAENVRPASLFMLGPEEQRELGILARPVIGGAFWPEAYALTTGRVRAQVGRALVADGAPLYCATDSVWTERGTGGGAWEAKVDGPAVVARTRLARIGEGPAAHLAFHGVASREAAGKLLDAFSASAPADASVCYDARRPIGLREGIRRDLIVGKWIVESGRKATTVWDEKRRLVSGGRDSEPWETVDEGSKS